jgi:hypothetical protein
MELFLLTAAFAFCYTWLVEVCNQREIAVILWYGPLQVD